MRIGLGTVLWGRRIDDLDYLLDVVAACGYHGVEFAQHYEQIYVRTEGGIGIRPVNGIQELTAKLRARGLALIGLVGGALADRMKFLGSPQSSPWFSVGDLADGDGTALAKRLAHPADPLSVHIAFT